MNIKILGACVCFKTICRIGSVCVKKSEPKCEVVSGRKITIKIDVQQEKHHYINVHPH
jgi:hypothetical protein